MIAVLAALAGVPAAHARPVTDADIGWPAALRRELRLPKVATSPCEARTTRAMVRLQTRISRDDPRDALYAILHDRPATNIWGALWYLPCDGGRLQVGVASGGSARETRLAVRRARRHLERHHLTRIVRLVAVRSSYRQLSDETAALLTQTDPLLRAGLLSIGTDTARNAIVIDVSHRTPEPDRIRLRELARDSPVNVVLDVEPAPDPRAPVPTYEARFTLDRGSVDRGGRTLSVTVDDSSCAADETYDTAERFAGISVRRIAHAYVLRARLRVNLAWPEASTCVGTDDPRTTLRTTVTLPGKLGRRGIVDGAEGPGGFRLVALPPVGSRAIRSLSPPFMYSGDDCDASALRQAFAGRRKSDWCFF